MDRSISDLDAGVLTASANVRLEIRRGCPPTCTTPSRPCWLAFPAGRPWSGCGLARHRQPLDGRSGAGGAIHLCQPPEESREIHRVSQPAVARSPVIRSAPSRGRCLPGLPIAMAPARYRNRRDVPRRYKGAHAHRIWSSIYSHTCFQEVASGLGFCAEQQLFYRLISGMHTSITTHICREYPLDEGAQAWGPNLEARAAPNHVPLRAFASGRARGLKLPCMTARRIGRGGDCGWESKVNLAKGTDSEPSFLVASQLYQRRLRGPEAKGYIENLYFTYLFVTRAVLEAGPVLS